MTISLWPLLAAYGLFYLVCSLFVFFNIYHIARFGLQSTKTVIILGGYIIAFILLTTLQLSILAQIDWFTPVYVDGLFLPTPIL